MTTFSITPSRWSESGLELSNIDGFIALIVTLQPQRVIVSDFDQDTAATIANRLIALGIEEVHVEGSGLASWPTPRTVYTGLIDRLTGSRE
jgi:hypothetical protein